MREGGGEQGWRRALDATPAAGEREREREREKDEETLALLGRATREVERARERELAAGSPLRDALQVSHERARHLDSPHYISVWRNTSRL